METVIYDIETLNNFFLYMDVNYKTGVETIFRIGEFHNELPALYEYLKRGNLNQVGFNNISFDSQVTQYIIENAKYWITWKYSGVEINNQIYEYTQTVINQQNSGKWSDYPSWKLTNKQLDLFTIWHFNNRAKMTSLKWVQFSMDWPNLQDMPVHHDTRLTCEQCDEVVNYCRNDIMSTKAFFDITMGRTELPLYKGIDKIQLRKDIRAKHKIDCLNFNDVKIGDELNKKSYTEMIGIDKYQLKKLASPVTPFTFGDCIPSYVNFKTPELQNFRNKIKDIVIDQNSKQNQPIVFRGTKYVIAKGGIHSEDKPRILKPTRYQRLRDADIGSQYPNSLVKRILFPRHLGPEWLKMYDGNISQRLEAKKQFKITKDPAFKSIDELYKLSLNGGGFGKLGEPTSWQYDFFTCMCVTIGNQFEILMLIEMLEETGVINVVSANTDGIVCLYNLTDEHIYTDICLKWEVIVGNNEKGKLEYTDYDLFVQSSVNAYIAVKSDDPKDSQPLEKRIKTKDDFLIDSEIHKNKSNRIVRMALMQYFVNSKDPREYIKSHTNIYDFCSCVRAKGAWHLEAEAIINQEHVVEKLQKTVRYYISNQGCKIIKHHPDGRQIQTEAGKWMQTVFNTYQEKEIEDYDIDYTYYVEAVYDLIHSIQPEVSLHSTQLAMNFAV